MAQQGRFLVFAALFTGAVYGQVDGANLNGTVTDSSGAIVPKAHVQVLSPDSGFRREADTGPSGAYNITGLPIGTYDVKFSHPGFSVVEVKGIRLFVGQTLTVDAKLEVGA